MKHSLKRDLLQTYAHSPKHKGLTEEQRRQSNITRVESCDDVFRIYIEIDNSLIKLARFEGNGCAISAASTELLLTIIEGRTIKDAVSIVDNYEKYINEEDSDVEKQLELFEIVHLHTSRKKCALAPINAIRKGIENG